MTVVRVKTTAGWQDLVVAGPPGPTSIPARVTTLPSSPTDGQEVIYVADAAAGALWYLRYNAGSASAYKWEYIGGSPIMKVDPSALEVFTGASQPTYGDGNYATGGNPNALWAITAPLAGDYVIDYGAAFVRHDANLNRWSAISLAVGGTLQGDEGRLIWSTVTANLYTSIARRWLKTGVAASAQIKLQHTRSLADFIPYWLNRWLSIQPVRVG